MEIGDIVKPTKESKYVLRSGCSIYGNAIVISVDPFILVSGETDMRWSATVKKENFYVTGKTNKKHLNKCLRRLEE